MENESVSALGVVVADDWRPELGCANTVALVAGVVQFELWTWLLPDTLESGGAVTLHDAGFGVDDVRSQSLRWFWDRGVELVERWGFVLADVCRSGVSPCQLGWLVVVLRNGGRVSDWGFGEPCWEGMLADAVTDVFDASSWSVDGSGLLMIAM
jgi:hypothetical protein